MKYTIIWPALLAFVISALLGPVIIPFLHKLKFGQYIRDEGPKAHQKKSGTPTMGGITMIVSVTVATILFAYLPARSNLEILMLERVFYFHTY